MTNINICAAAVADPLNQGAPETAISKLFSLDLPSLGGRRYSHQTVKRKEKKMEREWETVLTINGFEIKMLNGAEVGDCQDYIIEPALGKGHTYATVADAIKAITGD
ncbi:hypothetical protein [Paenibacillus macerans]|nr:hypothetical protein [Paenibacillus macerans]MCY7561586.1 hypothetical protein [Paenibacillus macerans]MEC0153315.1 hypothetical protein [Paenibacillus macerans]